MKRNLGALLFLAAANSVFAANIVLNPGFEDAPNPPIGGFITYGNGSNIGGWIVGGTDVDVQDTGHTNAHSGVAALDLSGTAPGSITQSLSTVIGQEYLLSFWYGAHSFHPYGGDALADVAWDGITIASVARPASPDPQAINWTFLSITLVATGTTTDLSFISNSPNGGILLDDISVEAVPEPGTISMLLAAGVAATIAKVRRQRA